MSEHLSHDGTARLVLLVNVFALSCGSSSIVGMLSVGHFAGTGVDSQAVAVQSSAIEHLSVELLAEIVDINKRQKLTGSGVSSRLLAENNRCCALAVKLKSFNLTTEANELGETWFGKALAWHQQVLRFWIAQVPLQLHSRAKG